MATDNPIPSILAQADELTRVTGVLADTQALLLEALGKLGKLQQANATLIEKWRAISIDWGNPNHSVIYGTGALALRSTADELEAATKEATQ